MGRFNIAQVFVGLYVNYVDGKERSFRKEYEGMNDRSKRGAQSIYMKRKTASVGITS